MKKTLLKFVAISLASLMVMTGCSSNKTETEASTDLAYKSITTEELSGNIGDDKWVVVDTRDNNAFNGWALEGVKRGGHIDGAVDFGANWLAVENEGKDAILSEALDTKGINPEKNVVLYDANGTDSKAVADYLMAKGYENIYVYDVNQWASDDTKTMVQFPGYELLVPASAVKSLIDGETPDTFTAGKKVKMIEGSWGEEKESYSNGHLPGAIHINTDSIEPPPAWMLADDATLLKVMLDNGISKNDTVIVSGEAQMAAYRVAMVLRYAGVEDVRVLNGGTASWAAAGYELETSSNAPVSITDFGGEFPGNPDMVDTISELQEELKSDKFTLVDNRTMDEFVGKSSGYSYHDKMGRIPGAVFGFAGKTDSNSLDYFRNIDNTMRNADEILAMWENEGIDVKNHLAFMCGSGWRAAEVLYYANVAGLEDVSLYSDGWIGWSNAGLPSETGEVVK
ncbi:MAG: rhodanese-like domain-containing protein [Proteocatella sp.]